MVTNKTSSELSVYKRLSVRITGGDGAELLTDEGRILIDFYGGHATTVLGYGHPRLLQALQKQAKTLFFASRHVEWRTRVQPSPK